MTTITLKVPDEQAHELSETARQMNMTLEDFALQKLLVPAPTSDEFLELVNLINEEDSELLERLA